ncbi:MAG: DUF2931 family protein [Gammaproteobacteria bacterium]|nr:MAG: DUF2931 family protein [Gammaproteobacteria bacterium]
MKAKRWYAIGLAISVINFLTACGASAMNKDPKQVTKFKWYAVATAPRGYPMEIISGTFFCKGMDAGINIPSGGTLTTGWGKSASAYVGSDEIPPLPDRVRVEFYSYIEKQVYEAEFTLPYDTILAKFQQQMKEHPNENNYSSFLLGVAPGGAVSVWLEGPQIIEVYFGQAKKIEMEPSKAFDLSFQSKEQSDNYISSALADSVTPEQLAYIKAHGAPIGIWARYRHLYKWSPVYKEEKPATDPTMPINFLNGERYSLPTHFNEKLVDTPKPLPLRIQFSAQATKDEAPYYIIDFDPVELMEAFEKLGAHGEKVFIEFDARIPVTDMRIRVYNDRPPKDDKTPKEFIELKKSKIDP